MDELQKRFFKTFQQNLESDNETLVEMAINNITPVSQAIGPINTEIKLLPILKKFCRSYVTLNMEHSAILNYFVAPSGFLVHIAQTLNADFIQYSGGIKSFPLLISILKELAVIDNTNVRIAAINSIKSLLNIHDLKPVTAVYEISLLLKKLCKEKQSMAGKNSAVSLLVVFCNYLGKISTDLTRRNSENTQSECDCCDINKNGVKFAKNREKISEKTTEKDQNWFKNEVKNDEKNEKQQKKNKLKLKMNENKKIDQNSEKLENFQNFENDENKKEKKTQNEEEKSDSKNSEKCTVEKGEVFRGMAALYIKLCNSTDFLPRKFALQSLVDLIPILPKIILTEKIVPLLNSLFVHYEDDLRETTVDVCVILLQNTNCLATKDLLMSCLSNCASDYSYIMRKNYAKKFPQIFEKLNSNSESEILILKFIDILSDPEDEVIGEAIRSLAFFLGSDHLNIVFKDRIYQKLSELFQSEKMFYKVKISEIICQVIKEECNKKFATNAISVLQKLIMINFDLISNNILSNIICLKFKISAENYLEVNFKLLSSTANSVRWRIRLDSIQHLLSIAESASSEIYTKKFLPLVENLLFDKASEIRDNAAKLAFKTAEIYGMAWFEREIFPFFLDLIDSQNYLVRSVPLKFLIEFGNNLPSNLLNLFAKKILTFLVNDKVKNVNEMAISVVKKFKQKLEPTCLDELMNLIQRKNSKKDFNITKRN